MLEPAWQLPALPPLPLGAAPRVRVPAAGIVSRMTETRQFTMSAENGFIKKYE